MWEKPLRSFGRIRGAEGTDEKVLRENTFVIRLTVSRNRQVTEVPLVKVAPNDNLFISEWGIDDAVYLCTYLHARAGSSQGLGTGLQH